MSSEPEGNALTMLRCWNASCPKSVCLTLQKAKTQNKTSEFGVKKGVLVEKVPTEKMGALVVSPIHLKKVQSSGFLYVKVKEKGGTIFCKNSALSRISLMISMSKAETVSLKATGIRQTSGWSQKH